MLAQPPAHPSQAMTVEFQFAGSQKQAQNIHSLLHLTHCDRQVQAQQVRCGRLRLHLTAQHCLQQSHRKQGAGQATAQQLHVHGMGEVAKTTIHRLIESIYPEAESIRLGGQQA
jgi:hypothetical protein